MLDAPSPLALTVIAVGATFDLATLQTPGAFWLAPRISCGFTEKLTPTDFFKESKFTLGEVVVNYRVGAIAEEKWRDHTMASALLTLWENPLVSGRGVE